MKLRSVGLLAVVALVLVSCGGVVPEASGPSEGIQVHGDWTIDVYNEDGSLDQSVEFSNDLTESGEDLLSDFLSSSRSVGGWQITAQGAPSTESPCGTSQWATCVIHSEEVDVSATDGVVTLSGSFEATRDGNISVVWTQVGGCTPDTAPVLCDVHTGGGGSFTAKSLTAPVGPISTDQTVQIQVDISFTSG